MPSRKRDGILYTKNYSLRQVEYLPHFWYKEKESKAKTLLYSCGPAFVAIAEALVTALARKMRVSHFGRFSKFDLVVDLNSDAINEHYGATYPLFTLFNIILASFSGKPVVLAPCSIGTFSNPVLKLIAFVALNRTRLIIIREMISQSNLQLIKINRPKIVFASDLAFLFESEQPEITKRKLSEIGIGEKDRPLVGITPSRIMHYYAFSQESETGEERRDKYIRLMAEVTDFIVERLGAFVLLIPHSLSATGSLASYSDMDDRTTCFDIYNNLRNKKRARVISSPYRADEIKGLIGACDLFVACRMHSSIASISQCVPTVVFAYGTKFEGIIGELVNQHSQIVDISLNYDTLLDQAKSKIISTWEERDSIRRVLASRLPKIQASARSTSIWIERLLDEGAK